ncbi:MAG: gamma-glutamylcyclotransferase family protein [Thermoproteota archaeon]
MDDARYFAYGSNLNIFQMMKRVGEWTTSKRAYLEGYKLVFNVKSSRWGGFAANIQKTGKSQDRVYGVVYFLKESKIDVMTSYEGVKPVRMDVKSEDGSVISGVAVHKWDKDTPSASPPKVYRDTIVEGLMQHGYAQDVIEKVKNSSN